MACQHSYALWITVSCAVLTFTRADLIELHTTAVSEDGFIISNSTGRTLPLIYLPDRFSIVTELILSNHSNQACGLSVALPSLLSVDDSCNVTISSNDSSSLKNEVLCSLTRDSRFDLVTWHLFNDSASSADHSIKIVLWVIAQNPTGIDINDSLAIEVDGFCSSHLLPNNSPDSWNNSCGLFNDTASWSNDSDCYWPDSLGYPNSGSKDSFGWENHSDCSWLNDTLEMQFGGPAVEIVSLDVLITPNVNESHTVVMTLPGYWQIINTTLSFELSSPNSDFLVEVALVEFSVGPLTPGDSSIKVSASLPYTATGSLAKRSIGSATTFAWLIGNITNTGPDEAQLQFELIYQVPRSQPINAGDVIVLATTLHIDGTTMNLEESHYLIAMPAVTLSSAVTLLGLSDTDSSVVSSQDTFKVTVTAINRDVSEGAPAYNVSLSTQREWFHITVMSLVPSIFDLVIEVTDTQVVIKDDLLQRGEQMVISFEGYFSDTFIKSATNSVTVVSEVTWNLEPSVDPSASYRSTSDEFCLTKVFSYGDDVSVIQYAHLVWIFLLSFVVGMLFLLIFLFAAYNEKNNKVHSMGDQWGGAPSGRSISYSGWYLNEEHFEKMRENAKNESIVYYLTQKDKRKKHVELGNIDIVMTINVDIQLEELRLNSMMQSFQLLLDKFGSTVTSAKDFLQKVYRKTSRDAKDVVRELNNEYRREVREMEARHQQELQTNRFQLEQKHLAIRRKVEKETAYLERKTMTEILNTLDQQRDLELSESQHLLDLSQGEETERLRKEYDFKKRIAIKKLLQEALDEVSADERLDNRKGRQLLTEYRDICAWLDTYMDTEISQKRIALEESMAEKKELAEQKNSQEEWNKRLLNTIATQTVEALTELERDNRLSEAESRQYLDRVRGQVQAAKEKYDLNRATQHAALHKRLTKLKRERLAEKEKEQLEALTKFEQEQHAKLKQNEQDPQIYLQSKLMLISSQKSDLDRLANKLDDKAKEELDQLESELVDRTKQEIISVKQNLCATLMKENGLTERMRDELMEQHQRDIERLEEARDEARKKQETEIEDRLTRLRENLAARKQEERKEKEKIRNYEENMVNKLLATQVAVSDEEREKVMEECRKNMIAVEEGLALTKLRQQRLLEEKLAKMRSRKMMEMHRKHEAETRRQMRSAQLDGESDSDNDESRTSGELIQKQAAEKLDLMSTVTADVDMETIREAMLRERALALKKQEERLGATMAQLQLDKAREMATIEEQQKALLQLKMNMFDEMTETGVMKNSQANKVIEAHQKGLETLERKMNAQRARQEEALKERLREKMLEREKSMEIKLERELTEMGREVSNDTVTKLRRVALRHKHMKRREQFRNKMEVEIAQTLEEVRRQFEVEKAQKLHNQEMELLSALVKFGSFSESQMKTALTVLFPAKEPEEIVRLMERMFDEGAGLEEQQQSSDGKKGPVKMLSGFKKGKKTVNSEGETLEEKVRKTIISAGTDKPIDTKNRRRRSSNSNFLKKGRLTPLVREEEEGAHNDPVDWTLPDILANRRPEPLGRAEQFEGSGQETDSDDDDDNDDGPQEAVLL